MSRGHHAHHDQGQHHHGTRPTPALSDLSITEFVALSRLGFFPHGLVVGAAVFDAGWGDGLWNQTREVTKVGHAMHAARALAVARMRKQAAEVHAEGVVGVRLDVEHHVWRGGHLVARFLAIGTAIGFDASRAPDEIKQSPSLRVNGQPFTSDLSGQDFVTLLRAGFRPVSLAMGTCVYEIAQTDVAGYMASWSNEEMTVCTRAYTEARETAMQNLAHDLFREHPANSADAPAGIVGMTVTETGHSSWSNIVEYNAVGTAVAPLAPNDPRRAAQLPAPYVVVPLDR
jgi:uncharacterized protein YbjQ (UPF0145 family)